MPRSPDDPNVGVRNPDLRSFDSGNSSHGEYRIGTPMKSSRASCATPTFFAVSMSIFSARRNQSSRGATQVVTRPRSTSIELGSEERHAFRVAARAHFANAERAATRTRRSRCRA